MHGCLAGVRVLELGGKGPTPFAGMVLADLGATVVAVQRAGDSGLTGVDLHSRGKHAVRLNLKAPGAASALLAADPPFDVVLEGFRPGVVERLHLGPEDFSAVDDSIVYARMSGYGQGNAYSSVAGHDVNFVAMGSALGHIGPAEAPPTVPLNLVADFGGGGMLLLLGVLAALVERARSGRGQVVDVAMTDAVALLMSGPYGMRAGGLWSGARGENLVDGGAPFYGVYETADGGYVSVGALEPAHYTTLLECCGLDPTAMPAQHDAATWPATRAVLAAVFRARPTQAWVEAFAGFDASFAPVLTMDDAPEHDYHRERGTFPTIDGVVQPAPAPRFSRTPSRPGRVAPAAGDAQALLDAGLPRHWVDRLTAHEGADS